MVAHANPEGSDVEDCARLVEAIGRLHVRNGFRNSLRPAQWQALRFYRDHPGAPLRELARDRHSTVSAASIAVSKLVQRGLLLRTRGKGTRNVGLHVSERGQAWLADDPLEDVKQALADLTQAELRQLLSCLSKVHDGLAEAAASKTGPDGSEQT